MDNLKFVKLSEVHPDQLLKLLNKQKIRRHLIEHALFDRDTLQQWIDEKNKVDASKGCKVRAIVSNTQLLGWCGIQRENHSYEIAIILDDGVWGIGKIVFEEILRWGRALGHEELYIHLHHTRPTYQFLRKMATNVYKSEILGSEFTTYQLSLE